MAQRKEPETEETEKEVGLEGAAEEESGFLHSEDVEGGDELSIGGGPPSAAGGEVHSPLPNRDDIQRT